MKQPWLLVLILFIPGPALAQAERYELGQRLRAFEVDFERYPDPLCRRRAAPSLKQTVWIPFSLQPGLAGQKLDQARFALRSAEPPAAETLWAESLWLEPDSRFIDVKLAELGLMLRPFYSVNGVVPRDARLRLRLCDAAGQPLAAAQEIAITALPLPVKLALPRLASGDHILKFEILLGGIPLIRREQMLSCVSDQERRVQALQAAIAAWPAEPASSERESARYLAGLLQQLANQETLETNYPACRLLAETESAVKALSAKKDFYAARAPGDYWLALAVADRAVPVRLLVPDAARKGQPLPLVVALHGASGSENLFFEGYGRGSIVKLCQERGWLLVAPRLSTFGGTFPIPEIIDEVARLYPVARRRIYLVGHSMGAAQAVLNTSKTPELFSAVAALSGGGLIRVSDRFKAVPFFVGVGSEDFAHSWARNLNLGLQKAGVAKVQYREYPDVDHIAIAQVALADVFRWLDEVAGK